MRTRTRKRSVWFTRAADNWVTMTTHEPWLEWSDGYRWEVVKQKRYLKIYGVGHVDLMLRRAGETTGIREYETVCFDLIGSDADVCGSGRTVWFTRGASTWIVITSEEPWLERVDGLLGGWRIERLKLECVADASYVNSMLALLDEEGICQFETVRFDLIGGRT